MLELFFLQYALIILNKEKHCIILNFRMCWKSIQYIHYAL